MKKVLSFGEILLRLSPDIDGNWIGNHAIPAYIGGAELNVAHALARWQIPVSYCSAAPKNYLSDAILANLETHGIDTSRMISSGDRIGIYYLAQGTDLKNAGVIYDRAGSSTAMLQPGQVDWDEVLKDISWFHFSAISPAVSANLAAVCEEALKAATEKKITISVDLNYRAKLWKWGKEPHEVMPSLIQYCDIVMGNIWAIERMAGIKLPGDFKTDKNNCLHQAEISSAMLMEKFSACKHVANTFRFDEGSSLKYYSTLYSKNGLTVSGEHNVSDIIDKVGSGDCFMAGLIYGFSNGLNEQQTLEFATAAAVDKMYVLGDATTSAPEKIKERIKNIQ